MRISTDRALSNIALQVKACDYGMPDFMRIGGVAGWEQDETLAALRCLIAPLDAAAYMPALAPAGIAWSVFCSMRDRCDASHRSRADMGALSAASLEAPAPHEPTLGQMRQHAITDGAHEAPKVCGLSPLEGDEFELLVSRHEGPRFPKRFDSRLLQERVERTSNYVDLTRRAGTQLLLLKER